MTRAEFGELHGLTPRELGRVERDKARYDFRGLTIGGLLGPYEYYLTLRRRKRWTQPQLAQRMGICVQTLRAMEMGKYKLDRLVDFWGH